MERSNRTLRFVNVDTSREHYSNAQIDDYRGLRRRQFRWRPPLTLSVRARFSHSSHDGVVGLSGTAGFGFWNDPFLMTERRIPALPRALWFFYSSPPSDLRLALSVPGAGWKAATIDALRPAAFLLGPLALPAALLMNLPPLYRAVWPPIQDTLHIREALVGETMTEWHTYVIDWGVEYTAFSVDGRPVLEHAPSPRGPLGFVVWLDNQYMVVKPWGRFRWGLLETPDRQWLELDRLLIEPK